MQQSSAVAANERPAGTLRVVLDIIAGIVESVAVTAVVATLFITFGNAIARYFLNSGIDWAADATAISVSMIAFPGMAAYYRRSDGMAYTALIDSLEGRRGQVVRGMGYWLVIAVCVVALANFSTFFHQQLNQTYPILGISEGFGGIWLGVGLFLMVLFAAEKLLRTGLANTALALLGCIVAALPMTAFHVAYGADVIATDPFIAIVPFMALAFLTGVPVAFVLAIGGGLYFLITGAAPLAIVPAALQAGMNSFILLAIPFFLLAGSLMEITGMAKRLVDMVQQWVGHWRGGLLMAEVLGTYAFSGINGAKAADIATIGTILKTPMRELGYRPTEFVAVLAASTAMAETVPPSVCMLVLGSVTTLSVGALFVAGVFPAAILATCLISCIAIRSRRLGFPKGPPFDLAAALRSIPPALPALGIPVIVIGGLVGGVASPTEASSFAAIYGLIAVVIVFARIGAAKLWTTMRDGTIIAATVLVMIASAHLLVQGIVVDGLGRSLTTAFDSFQSPALFLLVCVGALVVIGFVLEGIPAILVTAPILIGIAESHGVNPLQFGVLLVIATSVGVMMPPIGIGYYVACAVGEAPANATMRPSLIYNVFLILGLLIVTLVPQITLWLPHLFGMG